MQLEVKKYLFDVRQAYAWIEEFTAGKTYLDYSRDPMLNDPRSNGSSRSSAKR